MQRKTRLLKITVTSESNKAAILQYTLNLHKQKNPDDVKNIYVTPNLTPKEQETNRKLYLELKELNKDSNWYMINKLTVHYLKTWCL